MKQNLQYSRSQTRTPIKAKQQDFIVHNQSIQSTQISSQLNNSSIELSVFNGKHHNQSIDSIIFDNNINFTNNILESTRLDYSPQQQQKQKQIYQNKDYSNTIPDYITTYQSKSALDKTSSKNQIKNLDFLLRPKRKLSSQQKEVNQIIGRICEERLFPILIKECSQAGLLTKDQVKGLDIKQQFKHHKAEEFMLGNTPYLNKLNLNSSYNTIGNYAGTNKYLNVDIDYDKLKIDPSKIKISNKQQRIKHFFEGIHPAQIKMKVLPPLKPVYVAFEQAENARKKKKSSYSAHLDSELNQRSSVLSLPTQNNSHKILIRNETSLTKNNNSLNKSNTQNESEVKIYEPKQQFKLELDSIFCSSQIQPVQVYETDMERYKKRITPTPFKKDFMPHHFKDRIIALNVKY